MNPEDLFVGELFGFDAWPTTKVPKGPPGVYNIWSNDKFLYVGISWREPTQITSGTSKGLWGRLNSHASGRRSGDQFCVYVCDRFIIPEMTTPELRAVAEGTLSLDALTKQYVRRHLRYRFITTPTGKDARSLEASIRRQGFGNYGPPFLNPAG